MSTLLSGSTTNEICIALSLQSRNVTSETTHKSTTTAAAPPPPAPGIVRDPDVLFAVLQRLKIADDAICMFNADRSFQIMLRYVDDDEDTLFFDVCLVKIDEMEDAQWDTIAQLEHGGFLDQDHLVMGEWHISMKKPNHEVLQEAIACINRLYATTICPCNEYLIKDGGDMCPYCQLTSTPQDLRPAFCCVCQSETPQKHTILQPCCSQRIHTRCLAKWHARSHTEQCPMCREPV